MVPQVLTLLMDLALDVLTREPRSVDRYSYAFGLELLIQVSSI